MENKYQMTLEQNIFLAKRNLVDNVYAKSMNMWQEIIEEFNELLTEYYNSKDMKKISDFIYENCIDGIII